MRRLLTSIDLSQHIEEFRQALNRILNPPKRQPYMIIRRRSSYGGNFGVKHVWCVHCTKCDVPGFDNPLMLAKKNTWDDALNSATHHTHNHH